MKFHITAVLLFVSAIMSAQSWRDSLNFYTNLKSFEPEFYAYRVGRVNDSIGQGKSWYQRFCIFHVTDVHQYNGLLSDAVTVAQTKAHAIVNTGDNCNGVGRSSAEQNRKDLEATAAVITRVSASRVPYIVVPGNHDVPGITKKDYFRRSDELVAQFSPSVVWGDAEHWRSYGYVDFHVNEEMGTFRVIMLDPFDYDDGEFGITRVFMTATFSQKQIDWLIDALTEAADSGYHVITAMHYSFGDDNQEFTEENAKPDATFYQDPFMIPDIIDAIQHKKVLRTNYLDAPRKQNVSIDRDFTNVGDLDFVCHLFGHIHSRNEYWCQKLDGSKKYDILMLGEASLGAYGTALNKNYRDAGTVNEIEFSALMFDTIEKNIYRVGYGAYLNYDLSNLSRTTKLHYRRD